MVVFLSSNATTRQQFFTVIAAAIAIGAMTVATGAAQEGSELQAQCEQQFSCFQENGEQYTIMTHTPSFKQPCICCHPTNDRCLGFVHRRCDRTITGLGECDFCNSDNFCFRCKNGSRTVNGRCPASTSAPSK